MTRMMSDDEPVQDCGWLLCLVLQYCMTSELQSRVTQKLGQIFLKINLVPENLDTVLQFRIGSELPAPTVNGEET